MSDSVCKEYVLHPYDGEKAMRKLILTVPEVVFIAATRGALGLGAGLLLSDKLSATRRRAVGTSLLAIGLATTIPAARKLFGRDAELVVTPYP